MSSTLDNPAIPTLPPITPSPSGKLGRTGEACRVLDRLSPDDKRYPLRAPYLAVIFASAGRREEARAVLVRAPKPATLLPEEVELLNRAVALTLR